MNHIPHVFVGVLSGLLACNGLASGQYSKPIVGLDGKPAWVCRATSDGSMLVGTSRIGGEQWSTVTIWRAPDWQPEAAYTPIDTSMGWPMSAQLGWIQDVSDVGGVMIAGNPMMDVFIWWDGPSKPPRVYNTEGNLYWAQAVSDDGTAVVGLAEVDVGDLRACVYRPDGSIEYFAQLQDGGVASVNCVSPNGEQFGGASWRYPAVGDPVAAPAAWIDGVPQLMPVPAELFNVSVTSIDDAGVHAVGYGSVVTAPQRSGRVNWTRETGSEWQLSVDVDFVVEMWGRMRGDGRRQVGFTADSEGVVLRDVYHGDRQLNDVMHSLFPELGWDAYGVASAGTGAGKLVVTAGESAWEITLPALADLNEDRVLDAADFALFIGAFADGSRGADWNADGFVDFNDFDAFVGDFESGT